MQIMTFMATPLHFLFTLYSRRLAASSSTRIRTEDTRMKLSSLSA